ncbi:MAG: hypothetical protein NTY17_04370 [Planctomycetia bacterium]|nr:hypothetical protein [Planctomycetia bacterium]
MDDRIIQSEPAAERRLEIGHETGDERVVAVGPEPRDRVTWCREPHRRQQVVWRWSGEVVLIALPHAAWLDEPDRLPDIGGVVWGEPREHLRDSSGACGAIIRHGRQRRDRQHDTEIGVGSCDCPRCCHGHEDRAAQWHLRRLFHRRRDRQAGGHQLCVGQVRELGGRMHIARLGRGGFEDAGRGR